MRAPLCTLDREMCAGRAPAELRSAIEAAVSAANAELLRKPILQKYAAEIEELYG